MIYIVIPVFNRINFTKACIDSLLAQTNTNFKIVVVDDGSSDGTYELIKNSYHNVILLKGTGNLFWTASINLGIKKSLDEGADFVMTLNNDLIVDTYFIENMYSAIKKLPNAIIGSLEIDIDNNNPVYWGENIDWMRCKYNPLEISEFKGTKEVSHLPGRGMLIPKIIFNKIGFFAENQLPHYMADYDFTHQAIKGGFKVYINYDAKIFTYPEESSDAKNRLNKSLINYYNHLFTIRGGSNLKDFTNYTFRNCPPVFIPSYLLIGFMKRVFGYLIK